MPLMNIVYNYYAKIIGYIEIRRQRYNWYNRTRDERHKRTQRHDGICAPFINADV